MARDRHGRSWRADGDPARRPTDGFRARDVQRFAQLTRDALMSLPDDVRAAAAGAAVAVEDIPPEPLGIAPDVIPLATYRPGPPRRLVVYRRPLELRAESRADLVDAIRDAAGSAIARELGLPWEEDDED